MKFEVERDTLAEAVGWAARTLPSRPPVPVLAGMRIDAADDILHLSTYDYDVSTRIEVPARVHEAGTALVSGKLFSDITKSLPPKQVSFDLEGTKMSLKAGSSRFSMLTMPVAEYPQLPPMPEVIGTIDSKSFMEAVSQVTSAASKDETSPLLTGVRVEFEGERISLLATDRYRLALREVIWHPTKTDMSTATLVRARTLTDAAKSLAGTVTLGLTVADGVGVIGFESGGRHTTSALLDGEYPPVRRLFPESSSGAAVVAVAELLAAVRRVSLVAERNTSIRLAFTQGQVLLQAGSGDEAQASETLEAALHGEDIDVAFNPQYLAEGLAAISADFVRLSFTQPTKPVEFTSQEKIDGDNDTSFRYLLVPIRFNS